MANQPNANSGRPPPMIDDPNFKEESVIVSCTLYVIIAFLAVFGNGLVVGSFIRHSRLRTITNFFVVSLSVADILVGVISIPIWISMLLYSSGGPTLQTVYYVLDLFAGSCSILHLVAISLERFFAVVYPIRHRNTTAKVYYVFLVAVWVIPAAACGSSVELRNVNREANMLFLFIAFFVIPLLVILFTYARPTGSQSVKSTMSGVKEPAQSYTTATRLFAGNRREHTPIVGCRTLTVRNSVLGSGKTLAARAS